jgi:hypothetical protein
MPKPRIPTSPQGHPTVHPTALFRSRDTLASRRRRSDHQSPSRGRKPRTLPCAPPKRAARCAADPEDRRSRFRDRLHRRRRSDRSATRVFPPTEASRGPQVSETDDEAPTDPKVGQLPRFPRRRSDPVPQRTRVTHRSEDSGCLSRSACCECRDRNRCICQVVSTFLRRSPADRSQPTRAECSSEARVDRRSKLRERRPRTPLSEEWSVKREPGSCIALLRCVGMLREHTSQNRPSSPPARETRFQVTR